MSPPAAAISRFQKQPFLQTSPTGFELNRTTEAKGGFVARSAPIDSFSVTNVLHYRRRSKNAMERKEQSLRPRIGLVGYNWEPARERRVDTSRCETVREPIGEEPEPEPPVPARCSEVEMAQVHSRWGLLG